MSELKANITEQGNVTVVSVEGKLDFESQTWLKENIVSLMRQGKQVIIDLDGLNFVGSSGITSFILSIKGQQNAGHLTPRFCNVSKEFQKIFEAYDAPGKLQILPTREDAVQSFFRAGSKENN